MSPFAVVLFLITTCTNNAFASSPQTDRTTLTPSNPTTNGISTTTNTSTTSASQWLINTTTTEPYQFHLSSSSNSSYSFHPSFTTSLQLTIHSISTNTPITDHNLLFTFTFSDTHYLSLQLQMHSSSVSANSIFPACSAQTALQTFNTDYTDTNNTNMYKHPSTPHWPYPPLSRFSSFSPSSTINTFPLTFTITTDPSQNTLTFQYQQQQCSFIYTPPSLPSTHPFAMHLSVKDRNSSNRHPFSLSSIDITHSVHDTLNDDDTQTTQLSSQMATYLLLAVCSCICAVCVFTLCVTSFFSRKHKQQTREIRASFDRLKIQPNDNNSTPRLSKYIANLNDAKFRSIAIANANSSESSPSPSTTNGEGDKTTVRYHSVCDARMITELMEDINTDHVNVYVHGQRGHHLPQNAQISNWRRKPMMVANYSEQSRGGDEEDDGTMADDENAEQVGTRSPVAENEEDSLCTPSTESVSLCTPIPDEVYLPRQAEHVAGAVVSAPVGTEMMSQHQKQQSSFNTHLSKVMRMDSARMDDVLQEMETEHDEYDEDEI